MPRVKKGGRSRNYFMCGTQNKASIKTEEESKSNPPPHGFVLKSRSLAPLASCGSCAGLFSYAPAMLQARPANSLPHHCRSNLIYRGGTGGGGTLPQINGAVIELFQISKPFQNSLAFFPPLRNKWKPDVGRASGNKNGIAFLVGNFSETQRRDLAV